MKQLTSRQQQIFNYILKHKAVSNSQIKQFLELQGKDPIARITIIRDLDTLIKKDYITKIGVGRGTKYHSKESSEVLTYFDLESYFQVEMDQRHIQPTFNMDIFNHIDSIFSENELEMLTDLTHQYQKNRNRLSSEQQKKEIERLTIELSWKSSQIEGNTYTLLDTEALINHHREAPNTTKEEAIMILNHKKALDYCMASPKEYDVITVRKIEDIHRLLVENMGVTKGLRRGGVRITGTNYSPLDNVHQIQESLEKMVVSINRQKSGFQKSLISIALISYIQPFMDGNKRTSRLVGNAILNSHGACPLSYRSVDPVDYKKAMLLFYEKNSIRSFKDLFISQYQFSVENYFNL